MCVQIYKKVKPLMDALEAAQAAKAAAIADLAKVRTGSLLVRSCLGGGTGVKQSAHVGHTVIICHLNPILRLGDFVVQDDPSLPLCRIPIAQA